MANPTTNYSFAMPTNTDLVKDLPADFDIFGQAVDDRIKALNPETTAGDIAYRASTANAKTRLGIGTAGQVLTVNSGATAPEWATPSSGGMTPIATGTLSGASVTVSSLSTYDDLIVAIYNTTNSTANGITKVRINNNSGGNYSTFGHYWDGSSPQNYAATANDGIFTSVANNERTVNANSTIIKLSNCQKAGFTDFRMFSRVYTGSNVSATFSGIYVVSEAVSSLVLLNTGGNWAGGTYTIWGG